MKIAKRVGTGFLVLVVVAVSLGLVVSRDTPPRHPALVRAELPELISVRELRTDLGSQWGYQASSRGTYLSYWTVRGTQAVLVVRNRVTGKKMFTERDVAFAIWHPTREEVFVYKGGRLYRIDPEHPGVRSRTDVTPRGFRNWNIPNIQPNAQGRLIVTTTDRDPAVADLYSVDENGLDKRLIERNAGRTANWLLDRDATPRFRMDVGPASEKIVLYRDKGAWVEGFRVPDPNDQLTWLEIDRDGSGFLALSSRGRDKLALVHVDGRTGVEDVLFEDPDVDVGNIANYDPYDGKVDVVILNRDYRKRIAMSKRGEAFVKLVGRMGDRVDVQGLGVTGYGRSVTIAVSSREQSWEYFLLDLDEGTAVRLGEYGLRKRHAGALSQTTEVTIPARDGVMLPGYLSLPVGAEGPLPLVLRVHGGPAMHDVWGYDQERQFLTNRGYAVLSVNFRGSTGYGKAFQALGFKAFGTAMQDDLVDAARWAVDQGIADPKNMVIMGASYGGYAAALAMTRDPGLFKAAIVEHGVMDLEYQTRNAPAFWRLGMYNWTRYFGEVTNSDDVERMRAYSPVTHVENMSGPILLFAGKGDQIVGFEQSEAFVKKAQDAGKDVRAHYFERAGHGLSRWQDWVIYSRLVEDFLAEQIGGRSGGWDPIELAAQMID